MNAWVSIITAVDINTGEVIAKKRIKSGEYTIIKKTIEHESYSV